MPYCLINLGPWDWIHDSIDLVDKGNWGTFLLYATLVWVMCLGILPAIWHLLTKAGMAGGWRTTRRGVSRRRWPR